MRVERDPWGHWVPRGRCCANRQVTFLDGSMETINSSTATATIAPADNMTLLQFVRVKGVTNPADVKNAFQAWMRRGDHLPRALNQTDLDDHRKKNHTGRITGTYRIVDLEKAWNHWLEVKRSNPELH